MKIKQGDSAVPVVTEGFGYRSSSLKIISPACKVKSGRPLSGVVYIRAFLVLLNGQETILTPIAGCGGRRLVAGTHSGPD